MDANYNSDHIETIYLENIQNYVIINEEMYKTIISNIGYNYLLILFSMTCFVGALCSIKKRKNDYVLVEHAKPVTAEIIDKV